MSYRIQTKFVNFVRGERRANWRKKQVNRELTPEQLASGAGAGASPSPVARCAERCSERAEPADLRPPPPAATFWIKPPLELEPTQKHGIRTVQERFSKTKKTRNASDEGESHSHWGSRHIVVVARGGGGGGRDGVLGARARHGSQGGAGSAGQARPSRWKRRQCASPATRSAAEEIAGRRNRIDGSTGQGGDRASSLPRR